MGVDLSHYPYPRAVKRFPILRQSQLAEFDSCGLSAKFTSDYRRGWSTDYQARGTIFHRVASEALRAMALADEQKIPVDAALGILRDVLRQDWADRECPDCGSLDIRPGISQRGQRRCGNGHLFDTELVNVPLAQVKQLYSTVIKWAKDAVFPIQNLIDVELRLKAPLRYPHPDGGTVERVLSGKLDALFREDEGRRVVVKDWKDTWGLPAERDDDDELSDAGYFQQRMYAWLIFRRWPHVQEVMLHESYVRWSVTRSALIGRSMEAEIEGELAALAERFDRAWEERAHQPTPGKWCNLCVRPTACPIPAFARAEGRIVDAERAREVAAQLVKAEAIVKLTKGALMAYADVHGPVPVGDAKAPRALGYVKRKRVERPTREQLEQAIREAGELSALDTSGLYRERWGTRFQSHVPKDDGPEIDRELERQLEESVAQAAKRLADAAA